MWLLLGNLAVLAERFPVLLAVEYECRLSYPPCSLSLTSSVVFARIAWRLVGYPLLWPNAADVAPRPSVRSEGTAQSIVHHICTQGMSVAD